MRVVVRQRELSNLTIHGILISDIRLVKRPSDSPSPNGECAFWVPGCRWEDFVSQYQVFPGARVIDVHGTQTSNLPALWTGLFGRDSLDYGNCGLSA